LSLFAVIPFARVRQKSEIALGGRMRRA